MDEQNRPGERLEGVKDAAQQRGLGETVKTELASPRVMVSSKDGDNLNDHFKFTRRLYTMHVTECDITTPNAKVCDNINIRK